MLKLPDDVIWITRCNVQARPSDVVGETIASCYRQRHLDVPAAKSDRAEDQRHLGADALR